MLRAGHGAEPETRPGPQTPALPMEIRLGNTYLKQKQTKKNLQPSVVLPLVSKLEGSGAARE